MFTSPNSYEPGMASLVDGLAISICEFLQVRWGLLGISARQTMMS